VEALVAGYSKPLLGTLAVLEIGLRQIRAECRHFDAWLNRLEALVRLTTDARSTSSASRDAFPGS
jgi:hypothetical protein